MSERWSRAAWEVAGTLEERLVLLLLAHLADEDGLGRLGTAALAKRTGLGPAAPRALATLRRDRVIRWEMIDGCVHFALNREIMNP